MKKPLAAFASAAFTATLMFAAVPAAYAEEPGIEVAPHGVEFFDECGTMNDGFFFPDPQDGVVEYDIEGGFGVEYTVTAVLADGYVLAEGALGTWTFPALTSEPCETAPPTQSPEPTVAPDVVAPAADESDPTAKPAAELAETGVDGGLLGWIAASALAFGGAVIGGVHLTRRAPARRE